MFNQAVQITFSLAVREAQRRRHEFLTTEHVLYAMLFEETGQDILRSCGGDLERLRDVLDAFFVRQLETLPEDEEAVLRFVRRHRRHSRDLVQQHLHGLRPG
jgi:ATP-dependent Clp protease ATP-binding subunit ClpA